MPFPIKVCAVCSEEFELKPDKPGFANRCPQCSEESSAAESTDAKTKLRMTADERKSAKEANEARRQAMRNLGAVLEAAGSVFTNKYAEGYPGKRYYGGCEYADVVENLARDRAKKLFGAEHANVQPHSGSQANQAAYAAVLQPGDTILA